MTRAEYYAAIQHYCQYPQPDDCSIVLGCWGILYGYVGREVDYCRVCECHIMAKRKTKHNQRQLRLLSEGYLEHHEAW